MLTEIIYNITMLIGRYRDDHIKHPISIDVSFYLKEGYMCKICGHTFSTAQSLAAHIDSEHPEAEQPEIF